MNNLSLQHERIIRRLNQLESILKSNHPDELKIRVQLQSEYRQLKETLAELSNVVELKFFEKDKLLIWLIKGKPQRAWSGKKAIEKWNELKKHLYEKSQI